MTIKFIDNDATNLYCQNIFVVENVRHVYYCDNVYYVTTAGNDNSPINFSNVQILEIW